MPVALEQLRSRAWRTVTRGVALLLLLFAVADMALPQMCREDAEPLIPAQTSQAAQLGAADDCTDAQPHPVSTEDCFCCCSHIVSEEIAAPEHALMALSDSVPAHHAAVLPSAARHLFRPPRLG